MSEQPKPKVMNREGKSRHLKRLDADIADLCGQLRTLHHERDVVAAWLEGWDARDQKEPPIANPGAWCAKPVLSMDNPSDSPNAIAAAVEQGAEAGRAADSIPATGTIYDANPANSNPEPAQAQAETGLTADSGNGSANVSEGVTAEREPAGETGGEAEGHMEPPDAGDPPADPADIERDVLGMLSAIPVHCRQIYAALPYSRASIDMAMGELSLRHEIALIGDDGWALVSRQPQAEAAE
jgi:hypothetical protein